MRKVTSNVQLAGGLIAFLLAFFVLSFLNPAVAGETRSATIEIELYKVGLIIGGSGGSGTLHYKGKDYPISIGGVSLGATIGASKAQLVGDVFDLAKVEDIEGTYTAGQAGVALAGGEKHAQMKNSKGVRLDLKGKQVGLEFSLDLNGMELKLK